MTTDDRLVSGASSESSLPPNKSSGDIGERLNRAADPYVLVVRLSREDRRLQKPPLREYLLNNNRGEATLTLRSAVDDYAGFLTGNREALWAQDARSIQPKWD